MENKRVFKVILVSLAILFVITIVLFFYLKVRDKVSDESFKNAAKALLNAPMGDKTLWKKGMKLYEKSHYTIVYYDDNLY